MDDKPDPTKLAPTPSDLSRREFVAISVAGSFAGLGASAVAAAGPVVETGVSIKTGDGVCDAAFFHPKTGSYPGVLIWPDAFGLRPALRGFGRRMAAAGYAVLVPNPFYRLARAPVYESAAGIDFNDGNTWAKLRPLLGSVTAAGAAERDALAYVDFLEAQPQVDRSRRIGSQGYCMGGPLVVRTAAALPGRIGAGASFHGGALVTDKPDSPHLLAPRIKARMYFGIAASDDQDQPDAKDKLREAFAGAKNPAAIEVYAAAHGWCVPDMPIENGVPVYNSAQAERAWATLLAFYKAALA